MAGIVAKNESIQRYNDAITQHALDAQESRVFQDNLSCEGIGPMSFFSVQGITKFWDPDDEPGVTSMMERIISGIASNNMIFAMILKGSKTGINIRIGISDYAAEALKNSVRALYKGAELVDCTVDDLQEYTDSFGGVVVGCPSVDKEKKAVEEDRITTLSRAMLGCEFVYMVIARGLSPIQTSLAHDHALLMLQEANTQVRRSVTGGTMGNESIQLVDFGAQEYMTNLRLVERILNEGRNTGLWRTNTYFAVRQRADYQRLANAIKMTFGGPNSKPQRIRCIQVRGIGRVISQLQMIANIDPDYSYHPLGAWNEAATGQTVNLYVYQLENILDAPHLSAMTALPQNELPGYYLDDYVAFDTSVRKLPKAQDRMSLGQIMQAGREDTVYLNNPYYFDVSDLNRHGLIIGITGGGKTNTSKYLLGELWRTHRKPFLVIESAKREYWELLNLPGFEDLLLFTLGSEEPGKSIRYRINPFEVVGTVSLQTHIDYLLSTFKAAFELYPPMPYVLETSVYEIYKDRGWDIVTSQNTLGLKDYPTLTDLYRKIDVVTDALGYHQEAKENTKAALKARINSLRIGGKGAMMDTRYSVPIEKLLSTPAVLELEDLGDDDTKAFVIGMVLVQLYEYRKSTHQSGQAKLIHLTMIEEAHRLLKRVPEGGEGGNPRAKSVEFFCNLLAEIRSFGQGFLIADQIPTKLASDTLKNTNLKIVHRIVMEEDRQAIGRAMHMNEEQINYLSALRRGYAAVYAEGDNHPKMIRFPLVVNDNEMGRREVLEKIRRNVDKIIGTYDQNHNEHFGCTYCEEQCRWRDQILNLPMIKAPDRLAKLHKFMQDAHFDIAHLNGAVKAVFKPELPRSFAQQICALGHMIERMDLKESDKTKIMGNYIRKGKRMTNA